MILPKNQKWCLFFRIFSIVFPENLLTNRILADILDKPL